MADEVVRLREYLGLSQRKFAQSIGRSSVLISLHERGQPIGWQTIRAILDTHPKACAKLKITAESLTQSNKRKRKRLAATGGKLR